MNERILRALKAAVRDCLLDAAIVTRDFFAIVPEAKKKAREIEELGLYAVDVEELPEDVRGYVRRICMDINYEFEKRVGMRMQKRLSRKRVTAPKPKPVIVYIIR